MKVRLKSKVLGAAIALAFAGSAHAALDFQQLGFYASNGSANSVFFDLGTTMSEFTPAATSAEGLTIVWDLANSTVTSNTPGSTVLNYGSTWSGFTFTSSTIWGVIAPDEVLGDIYTTTLAPNGTLNNTTSDNAYQAALSVDSVYYNALGSTGTHATSANGASLNLSSGNPNALHFNGFGANDQWRNQTPFAAGRAGDGSMPFYKFAYDLDPGPALRTNFAGTWTLNSAAGTLTYSVAAIPEPSTYALVAAGLVGLGSLVRRRKNG